MNVNDAVMGWEDPLQESMATRSSIHVWRIPWTEEPGGLEFTGLQRVRHDWSNLACTPTYYPALFTCLAVMKKYHRLYARLKIQKLIFSQFWRLEVRDRGFGWLSFRREHSSWLVDGCFLIRPHTKGPGLSLCVPERQLSGVSFYKDTNPIR